MIKQPTHSLNARDLLCPEPVMLLHKSMRTMESGSIIEVIATDPSTTRDIPKFCHFLGHQLLAESESDGQYRFTIKKQ